MECLLSFVALPCLQTLTAKDLINIQQAHVSILSISVQISDKKSWAKDELMQQYISLRHRCNGQFRVIKMWPLRADWKCSHAIHFQYLVLLLDTYGKKKLSIFVTTAVYWHWYFWWDIIKTQYRSKAPSSIAFSLQYTRGWGYILAQDRQL